MFKRSRTFKNARAILIVVFALFFHFAIAGISTSNSCEKMLVVAHETLTRQVAQQCDLDQDQNSLPPLYEECREDDDPVDDGKTVDVESDEFIATLPHLNVLVFVATYPIEDLRLTLPAHRYGVSEPPDLQA